MTHTIRRTTIAALLAVTLGLGACGGSDDSSDGSSNGDGSEQTDSASDSDSGGDGDTNGDQPAGGAEQGETDDGDTTIITAGDVPGVSAECEALVNFIGVSGQLVSGQVEPDAGRAIIDDFVANVGEEVRAEAAVIAESTVGLLDAIEELGSFENVLTTEEGMAVLSETYSPEYDAATQRINDYFAAECGGLDGSGG